MYFLSLHII